MISSDLKARLVKAALREPYFPDGFMPFYNAAREMALIIKEQIATLEKAATDDGAYATASECDRVIDTLLGAIGDDPPVQQFIPHGMTCQANHDNGTDWGRCGDHARYLVHYQGHDRYVCASHYARLKPETLTGDDPPVAMSEDTPTP